ncbi:hypothetical protein SUGI_1491350 [Cryptomeria japonica]|uniref:Uncharacterized protein n=1 Tax=Cryptomeria japonica TaxID=3369 RepID=A0AAD3NTS6_CRYJA|nr:hypothetical protein SUGI_1373310 [Cryptomeria japonica]GLJ59073.1 hypothetical protein SUGI_1491350 [Cryptomeria japonica]
MSFEAEGMKVVQLIDPTKGQRYVDMVDDRGDVSSINQLYNLAAGRRDDVNPTADGSLKHRVFWVIAQKTGVVEVPDREPALSSFPDRDPGSQLAYIYIYDASAVDSVDPVVYTVAGPAPEARVVGTDPTRAKQEAKADKPATM